MARYRKIDTRTWNDQKFNQLSDDAKLVFFMLLTHPHLTPIGAMRSSLAGLASELKWPIEKFKNAFEESCQQNMIQYDEESAFIWLPNFLKYNKPASPNVVSSWDDYLDYLPECDLKDYLMIHVKNFLQGMKYAFQKALPEAFGKPLPNQEQEQEQEQELEQEQDQEQEQKEKILSGKPDAVSLVNNNFYKNEAREILEFLNEKTGKNFRPEDTNLKLIQDVLKSGISSKQCFQVIANQTREWEKQRKTFDWLRPKTLFNRVNFEQYLGELGAKKPEDNVS